MVATMADEAQGVCMGSQRPVGEVGAMSDRRSAQYRSMNEALGDDAEVPVRDGRLREAALAVVRSYSDERLAGCLADDIQMLREALTDER